MRFFCFSIMRFFCFSIMRFFCFSIMRSLELVSLGTLDVSWERSLFWLYCDTNGNQTFQRHSYRVEQTCISDDFIRSFALRAPVFFLFVWGKSVLISHSPSFFFRAKTLKIAWKITRNDSTADLILDLLRKETWETFPKIIAVSEILLPSSLLKKL
jgi:hypothetical protein